MHIAGDLDPPDKGTVAVGGQDVWAMRARERAAFRDGGGPRNPDDLNHAYIASAEARLPSHTAALDRCDRRDEFAALPSRRKASQ